MKDSKINYLLVGTFVIAMLSGLVIAIATLTGRTGATDIYFTHYENVSGIKFGTKVLYMGYPVGQVEDVIPEWKDDKLSFRLKLSVIDGWRIPVDSKATIATSGLLSAITIDIRAGESKSLLKPGEMIDGVTPINVFASVADAALKIGDLAEHDVRDMLVKLNHHLDSLGLLVDKDAPILMNDIKGAAAELAERTPTIMTRLSAFSEHLNTASTRVEALLNTTNTDRIDAAISNIAVSSENFARMAIGLHSTREKLDGFITRLNNLHDRNRPGVDQSVDDLRHTMDSVARQIDAITYNLEGTSRHMLEFSRELQRNPGLLLNSTPPADEELDKKPEGLSQ